MPPREVPDHPKQSPDSPVNEKNITVNEKNRTTGHISAELGINMKWLDSILGSYSNRPETLVTKNFLAPGKGEGKMEGRYWSTPRIGETYTLRLNEDPTTGGTLIRKRGEEVISTRVPPEAIRGKPSSPEEVKKNTRAALEDLLQDVQTA